MPNQLVLEVLLLFTLFNAVALTEEACPPGCTCEGTKAKCDNIIPVTVPSSVANIVLSEVSDLEFHPRRFCNVTWPSVKRLSVSTQHVYGFDLEDGVFDCLDFLEAFQFSSDTLLGFSDQAFSGLTGLLEFDITGCGRIGDNDVQRLLSVQSNFPHLTKLILAMISDYAQLHFDQNLVNVLCYRPVAYLDFSFNEVVLDFYNLSCLCESQLTTLIMRNTYMSLGSSYIPAVCHSLQIWDDRTYPPTTESFFKHHDCIDQTLPGIMDFNLIRTVRVFYHKAFVAHRDDFTVRNCTFLLYPNMSTTELHLTDNDLPNYDIKLSNSVIEFIDLSHNNIETINPDALLHLPSLVKVDLSHNNLHMMSSYAKTWLALFAHKQLLQAIDLSFNQLTNLPKDTFKLNVNLRELNLQGNRFEQITFDTSQLFGLELLDLRNNSVQFLEEYSRLSLQDLHDNRQVTNLTVNSSTKLEVLLFENPVSCSCLSLDFLQWFVSSPIFSSSRYLYSCQANDKAFPITYAAVEEAREDCDRPKHKRGVVLLTSTLSVIAVLLLAVVTINLYKRYNRKHLDQRYADRVRLLQENNIGFRYPVFLSYCSDDREFVLFNILRPLRVSFFLVLGYLKFILSTEMASFSQFVALFQLIAKSCLRTNVLNAILVHKVTKFYYINQPHLGLQTANFIDCITPTFLDQSY